MEKERLGFAASSVTSTDALARDALLLAPLWTSEAVAMTAVRLMGVPGLLRKNTLSPSSLDISSTSSGPADTDLARTKVGLCWSSGNTLFKPFPFTTELRLFDSVLSLDTFAVKNWVYCMSLSGFAGSGSSSVDGSSPVISMRADWC
jgi:hypothetical protein